MITEPRLKWPDVYYEKRKEYNENEKRYRYYIIPEELAPSFQGFPRQVHPSQFFKETFHVVRMDTLLEGRNSRLQDK